MRVFIIPLIAICAILTIAFGTQLVETNTAGYMQVKQAAVSGDMSVHTEPGMYSQMFGEIHTYKVSGVYDFETTPINVQFNDASKAGVTGQIKFKLPRTPEKLLKIHRDFRSYDNMVADLVEQFVSASLKQSSPHFGAEDLYSTRRSEFIDLTTRQVNEGLFATKYTEDIYVDASGNEKIRRRVSIAKDKNGNPVIAEPSIFEKYGVEVVQLVIKDFDFDARTDELIAKRKEAEQQEIVAKADAKRAKQDAIKAEEQGKAKVATAKYAALVVKETAVIEAQKLREVAEENALKALEEKKKLIAIGEGEAEAARLKVAAGLSPLEEATIQRDTRVLMAEHLSKLQLPRIVMGGGGQGGNETLDMFTTKMALDIMDSLETRGAVK